MLQRYKKSRLKRELFYKSFFKKEKYYRGKMLKKAKFIKETFVFCNFAA